MHVFIQHTSASLTINENADPDVPQDLAMALDKAAPESWPYSHTCEGPDDMPAHVKTALTDSSLSIPVASGRLLMGTWQGIYLCCIAITRAVGILIQTLQVEAIVTQHGPNLYFYYSAMNAGKSTTLLQAAYNYQERGMRPMLLTPQLDTRDGVGMIASRIGLKSPALRVFSDGLPAGNRSPHSGARSACLRVCG